MNFNRKTFYLLVLSSISFFYFIVVQKTAFDWPAIDNAFMLERFSDPYFLTNDFFTNSSTTTNPRFVFGFFVFYLAKIMKVSWYSIFFGIKLILSIFFPMIVFLVLDSLFERYLKKEQKGSSQLFLFVALLALPFPQFSNLFSIAWWSPFQIQSNAHSCSIFIGFLAIWLRESTLNARWDLSFFPFLLASLFHPAIGLFIFVFYFSILVCSESFQWKKAGVLFCLGWIVPICFIKIFLSSDSLLSTSDFIKYYCLERHPGHYDYYNFGSLTPFSWQIHFCLMVVLYLVSLFFFKRRQKQKIFLLSGLLLFVYIFSVWSQFFFIHIFPIKSIAILGPSRLSLFGFWGLAFLWSLFFYQNRFDFVFKKWSKTGHLDYIVIGLFVMFAITWGLSKQDNPFVHYQQKNPSLYRFVESTPKKSTFAIFFGELNTVFPLVAKRAVVTNGSFPFSEKFFQEFQERHSFLFGKAKDLEKIQGRSIGEKIKKYNQELKPNDFINFSKKFKLDYVIIHSDFSWFFRFFQPIFSDKQVKVYRIKDLEIPKH